jgi:pimeloyl-ACP methyl ester carboxylesterase
MLNTVSHGTGDKADKLLIAHGLFGSARNWGVIAKRLSDSRDVVAVDMRNHGASPWKSSQSYEDMADDLAQVITGRWDVLGHSMGGKAAMVLALKYPHKVNRLVVADIAPVTYTHSQIDKIEAMRAVDLASVANRAEAAEQLQGLEPGLAEFFLQSLDLKEKKWRLNLDVLAVEMPKILSFPAVAGQFEGEVLFLTGAQSDYVKREHRDTIKALFPKAKFAKIPGAGHWLHAEKPREFEAAVRVFLA